LPPLVYHTAALSSLRWSNAQPNYGVAAAIAGVNVHYDKAITNQSADIGIWPSAPPLFNFLVGCHSPVFPPYQGDFASVGTFMAMLEAALAIKIGGT